MKRLTDRNAGVSKYGVLLEFLVSNIEKRTGYIDSIDADIRGNGTLIELRRLQPIIEMQ